MIPGGTGCRLVQARGGQQARAVRLSWENPHEWLLGRIARAAKEGDTAWLLVSIRAMATELDADTVQDLFQAEMGEDGYFGGEEE